jgi:hypothetical protein
MQRSISETLRGLQARLAKDMLHEPPEMREETEWQIAAIEFVLSDAEGSSLVRADQPSPG